MTGFRKFISSWLVKCDRFNLLIDPGPLSTIPHLLAELQRLQTARIDYILLTHIHIDHAGGTGALLKSFPQAQVICHPDGIRHLVSPERLWKGSQQVLGELAGIYGEIIPVPEGSISYGPVIGATGVRAFLTPGHAQHHLSYLLEDILFAGELAGVRCEIPEGIYMRPATPPRFILNVALDSLEKMAALAPRNMVFAHYGIVENALEHLQIAGKQLLLWVRGAVETVATDATRREDLLTAWLLDHDEYFRNGAFLPADIRVREHYFLGNSLRGIIEFVDSLTQEERRVFMVNNEG
jgi:glyoxylase-like metal-dependent hydrolase (beta-lactamase superfamily II)